MSLDPFILEPLDVWPHHRVLRVAPEVRLDGLHQPGHQPVAYHTPIQVPHHWKELTKADLDRDVALEIVEPVPQGEPTIWSSRMVVVSKKSGKPRRTVDLQALNQATLRETHHTPSPYEQVNMVPPRTLRTVLDAWNGYHGLVLHEEDRYATTFITEWGRYRYRRAPQGFHAAGDAYTRRVDVVIAHIPRKTMILDDTILWVEDLESAFFHTFDFLAHCAAKGVTFNAEKFVFARAEVEFAGFKLHPEGYGPSDDLLDAIRNFPAPTDITGVRSWFGLVNQVSYAYATAADMAPFRELLKRDSPFYWDDQVNTLFLRARQHIADMVADGVQSFDKRLPTALTTDWSMTGLGFTLMQKHCRCPASDSRSPYCCREGWRTVLAGSRFTSPLEAGFAPIEGEALAVSFALEKCKMFVLGCPDLTVVVDHQPLVRVLGDKQLADITNPRLMNLKEKVMRFSFKIRYLPGSMNKGADACSRYPVAPPPAGDTVYVAAMEPQVAEQVVVTWDQVRRASRTCATTRRLVEAIKADFRGYTEDPMMRPYIKGL